jgi:hypothetical protein
MRFLKTLIVIAIFLNISVVAFAHPGRTDSNGGHYNHDTGEYHYHHGYPEHHHYDMDGDGDRDCPYLFDDKTDDQSEYKKPLQRYLWIFLIVALVIWLVRRSKR